MIVAGVLTLPLIVCARNKNRIVSFALIGNATSAIWVCCRCGAVRAGTEGWAAGESHAGIAEGKSLVAKMSEVCAVGNASTHLSTLSDGGDILSDRNKIVSSQLALLPVHYAV